MNSQLSLTILAFSNLQHDARVLRQAQYLAPHYDITVIAYGKPPAGLHPQTKMYEIVSPTGIGLLRKLRTLILLPLGRVLSAFAYERWYWQRSDRQSMFKLLNELSPQLIHANDWNTLPIAARIAHDKKAIFVADLHEYSPLQYQTYSYHGLFFNPMAHYFIRTYAIHAAASVTVSQSIAHKYEQVYNLHPHVVMNTPAYCPDIIFKPLDNQYVNLVHHGAAVPARQLDLLIKTLALTDSRYKLHFLLINPNSKYVSQLKLLAQQIAPERVIFHPAVKPHEIVNRIAGFDMGFYLLPPTCFNQAAALPNKFFDFISAGLAVCIGPSSEMANLTRKFGFGVVTPDFTPESAADTLNALTTTDINHMKQRAIDSRKTLSADIEMSELVNLYADLVNKHHLGTANER